MDIIIISFFLSIFTVFSLYFAAQEEGKYFIGAYSEFPECNHDYIETEYYGGKCGGTQFYECKKCKNLAKEHWNVYD